MRHATIQMVNDILHSNTWRKIVSRMLLASIADVEQKQSFVLKAGMCSCPSATISCLQECRTARQRFKVVGLHVAGCLYIRPYLYHDLFDRKLKRLINHPAKETGLQLLAVLISAPDSSAPATLVTGKELPVLIWWRGGGGGHWRCSLPIKGRAAATGVHWRTVLFYIYLIATSHISSLPDKLHHLQ
jgi:hypothetical protein